MFDERSNAHLLLAFVLSLGRVSAFSFVTLLPQTYHPFENHPCMQVQKLYILVNLAGIRITAMICACAEKNIPDADGGLGVIIRVLLFNFDSVGVESWPGLQYAIK